MNGKSRRGVARALAAVAVAAAAGTGCVDSGLPDRNLPKAQAEHRTYGYPVYQVAATAPEVWDIGGRRWVAGAAVETIEQTQLRAIANANGTPVYALSWDQEPFDRLYSPVGGNRWRVVEAID